MAVPLAALVYGFWSVVSDLYDYFAQHVRYKVRRRQPLAVKYKRILQQYFAYYKALTPPEQKLFESKLKGFMYSKRFIARSVPQVTDEMRVLISATAVQITFGLPGIYLEHFDKILIYADQYYSRINRRYHKGEVNPLLGIIVISWRSFVEGFGDLRDSYNLGIHEMAHAIHLENRIKNDEYDFLDHSSLEAFELIAKREMSRINSGEAHFMRSYAGANEHEFFAVSLEYFFEQPDVMNKHLPDLYEVLCRLLNQHPLRIYQKS